MSPCTQQISPAQLLHDVIFYFCYGLRKSDNLNRFISSKAQQVYHAVDTHGMSSVDAVINKTRYQQLAVYWFCVKHVAVVVFVSFTVPEPTGQRMQQADRKYGSLARACIKDLHRLYPVDSHRAFFHGISDIWTFFVLIIEQCSVVPCDPLPWELASFNIRNTVGKTRHIIILFGSPAYLTLVAPFHIQLAWRGLSGSDDVLWACLALTQFPSFLDVDYTMVGLRGVRQLYKEAEYHYINHIGNLTELYWNTNKDYTATIGISLWVAASARLYEATQEPRYLSNALSAYEALTKAPQKDGTPLITSDGEVFDGRRGDAMDKRQW